MSELLITPFDVGRLRFDLAAIYDLHLSHPSARRVVDAPMICYHLQQGERSVLLDATSYDWEEISKALRVPEYQPPPALLEQMKRRGIDRGDVDTVVITHAHFDHYGALSLRQEDGYALAFPSAQHYLGAGDWEPELFDDFDRRTLGLVHDHGRLTLVEGAADLGQGLMILPAAGETAGHQVLRAQSGEQTVYFAGDLYHHTVEFGAVDVNVYWADAAQMTASKRWLMETAAAQEAAVYFSHIAGAQRVIRDAHGRLVWEAVV
ncbi:MAG: MBL fold metallo-hydrolase [Candidatus Promineifilaceae bacterium]|nr:MBL fold metallo-hydrolase [Candidatus Promineifilaceae bacterium]